jgi:hypothetical protein
LLRLLFAVALTIEHLLVFTIISKRWQAGQEDQASVI